MTITVFLADDHTVVRQGLRLFLTEDSDIQVVGEAGNGRDTVRRVEDLRPDVAVLDLAMPGLDGIEATQRIAELCPSTRVVILSMHSALGLILRALEAGARAYLLKESAGMDLIQAVHAVHAGHRYLSPGAADEVIAFLLQWGPEPESDTPLARLSRRERDVLRHVVDGMSTKEIAEALSLSLSTVNTYRSRMMQKLGVTEVAELVRFAIKHGLTSVDKSYL